MYLVAFFEDRRKISPISYPGRRFPETDRIRLPDRSSTPLVTPPLDRADFERKLGVLLIVQV